MARIGLDPAGLRRGVGEVRTLLGQAKSAVFSLQGALLGLGVTMAAKKTFDVGNSTRSMQRGLEAATGSVDKAQKEYAFLTKTADELGLEVASAGKAFVGLTAAAQGTSLAGEETRRVFTAISMTATALGLDSQTTEGALLALQQMMSKGTVQADELRGQLGERIPGAFNMAAEAMGITTIELSDMLDKGELLASDLLPRLSNVLEQRFGKAAATASKEGVAEFNRFKNSVREMFETIAQGGVLEAFTGSIRELTKQLRDPSVKDGLSSLAGGLASILGKMTDANSGLRAAHAHPFMLLVVPEVFRNHARSPLEKVEVEVKVK